MIRFRSIAFGVLTVICIVGTSPANAQIRGGLGANVGLYRPRVTLGCAVEMEKVARITNTTANAISAGTVIHFDALLYPNQGQHWTRNITSGLLAAGQSFQIGVAPMVSCTAWYDMPMLIAP